MISVIIPIYNVSKYLRQCLDSVCSQTYQDIELILVDDGSTDGCYEICEEYRQKDSRIKVIHKPNGGLVSARKAGMQAAQGEYIAYVDGDDWIEPDMYERMHRIMEREQVDVVMCGRYEDTGSACKEVYHGILEGRYGKRELLTKIYPQMIVGEGFFEWCIFPGVWDKLFRRECVEEFQLAVDEKITMGEDAACVYPCLLNADSIYVMHECLYHYRQTTSSMVKTVQNYEAEREQFRILFQTVNKSFEKYTHIYDLREQWKKYVLFLMIPRSDGLLPDYEEREYLFPFSKVKKGSNIILYGAGTYGQRLYRYLNRTGFCHVAAWVDRNFAEFQKQGLNVENPAVVSEREYDFIVIANTYEKSRKGLYQELIKKYPEEKIQMIDEKLIFSEETRRAFHLFGLGITE